MLPYLTAALPGCGGALKTSPEDFIVEEIPRYAASGEGTHLYITIEKRGLTTLDAVQRIARALGCRPADVGYAGMKDAVGLTRQRLSVEHVDPQRVQEVRIEGLRVLGVERHGNKLRIGHLAGNRFDLRLRGCAAGAVELAGAVVAELTRRGAPNYFGPQRFGRRGRNAEVGAAALHGDFSRAFGVLLGEPADGDEPAERAARERYSAGDAAGAVAAWPPRCRDEARWCRAVAERGPGEAAWRAIDRRLRTLFYSAAQSEVFNRVLARRIETLDRLMDGDVAWKHVNGACFRVESAVVEQARCAAMEISPTGPIPGAKMTEPQGAAGAMEAEVCAALGVVPTTRRTPDGVSLDGARRPLRVPLGECAVSAGSDAGGEFLRLEFSLPAGAYATSVVREISKVD